MSRMYHPDKHSSSEKHKRMADDQFNKIKTAHEGETD